MLIRRHHVAQALLQLLAFFKQNLKFRFRFESSAFKTFDLIVVFSFGYHIVQNLFQLVAFYFKFIYGCIHD